MTLTIMDAEVSFVQRAVTYDVKKKGKQYRVLWREGIDGNEVYEAFENGKKVSEETLIELVKIVSRFDLEWTQ